LVDNNVPEERDVVYVKSSMDGSYSRLLESDIVVGHQTVAWMAVALGVPTLMMAEDMPTHFRNRGAEWINTPSWDKVVDLFRYPLDILNVDDTLALLEDTISTDCDIEDWKRRMIGEPIDNDKFLSEMERFL